MKGFIYKINNKVNNKYYIGSTNNFKRRKSQHLQRLRDNKHRNIYLQSAYNKYGKDNFEVFILKEFNNISTDNLYKEEQIYLDKLNREISYNLSYLTTGGGADSLKKPCYILKLDGEIVKKFDSRNEAAYYLGIKNSGNLAYSTKNPKSKVKSKIDGQRYRVINVDYYKNNIKEIKDWYYKSIKFKCIYKYLYKGELLNIKEIAEKENVHKETIRLWYKKNKKFQ